MARNIREGDGRAVDQRTRLSDRAEDAAKLLVERLLDGVKMCKVEKQSRGEYDYHLLKNGHRFGALEVTLAADDLLLKNFSAVLHSNPFIEGDHVMHGWSVHLGAGANIKRIRSRADVMLAHIERDGLDRFFYATHADRYASVREIWTSLCIEGGSVMEWRKPRLIGLSLPSRGPITKSPDHVQEAVEREAKKEDNRRKLSLDESLERHLFVVIEPRHYAPWCSMNDCDLPAHGPDLPGEVTTVWVAAKTRFQDRWIVWSADRGQGWTSCGVVCTN